MLCKVWWNNFYRLIEEKAITISHLDLFPIDIEQLSQTYDDKLAYSKYNKCQEIHVSPYPVLPIMS